jgi:hypothetical protein
MAKKLAILFGIVFVLVGLLGFIPNPIVGSSGYFLTDAIHNIVHILVGVVLLLASGKGGRASATALKVFGVIYLVLFLDGLAQTNLLGFIKANQADTYLHLVLGIVLLIAGATSKGTPMMDSSTM